MIRGPTKGATISQGREVRFMTIETGRTTAEELLRMPDDGFRYELVRGELRKMPPAGSEHGYLALEIAAELRNHVRENGLGRTYTAETGFRLASDPDTVRAPDAAFVSRARLDEVGEVRGYWPGAPDLAVEVVSPHDTHAEVMEKALAWLEAGSRMVLVMDAERRTVTVFRSRDEVRILTEGDTIDGADVVPGWKLPLAELFASNR
jgi:Uma2 family endonuclease